MTVLPTSYFGPISWYQQLFRADKVLIEQHEHFVKQTLRNRCTISTASGRQTLTVPVEHGRSADGRPPICSLRISDHGNWRHLHWNALQSAYHKTPFFDYYADDLRPFFEEHWDSLIDFNEAIRQTICELLDIHPVVEFTDHYSGITPQPDFQPRPYYQLFSQKNGFQPNLSILDLLFEMGPEAVLWLR